MVEPTIRARKPPLRAGVRRTATSSAPRAEQTVEKGRRGRPSQEDYAKWVIEVARADLFQLEACAPLAQLPGIRHLARGCQHLILPAGAAIRELIDQAVADVQVMCLASETLMATRICEFLRIWYLEGDTVVRVALELKLSRSYISHTIQRRALDLVAKRFLELAWRFEASA